MLKDKQLTECSREKWIEAQKRDAEQKARKAIMRKAIKPNCANGYH